MIIHAKSKAQAEQVLEAIRRRLAECGLELHPEKTKIVYCQDNDRKGQHEHIQFDFLGYTFRPRRAKNRRGKFFVSFLPGISNKAAKAIRETIRDWRLAATRNNQSLEEIAGLVNPSVRGWVNYYGRFYRSALTPVLRHLERALIRWACTEVQTVARSRHQRSPLAGSGGATRSRICSFSGRSGYDRRLDHKSRMRREPPVRIREGLGVKFPRATRLCRRFSREHLQTLHDVIDDTRLVVWSSNRPTFFEQAILDMDGILVETTGQCKQGMDIAYDGTWGYHAAGR